MPIDAAALDAIQDSLIALTGITDRPFIAADTPVVLEAINTYCNRVLYKQAVVDQFRSVRLMRDYFFTRHFPIISVSEIVEDGTTLVADVDYTVDNAGAGRIRRLNGLSTQLWRGNVTIKVTYVAGYDPYPQDLMYAMTEVVARDYRKKKQRDETDDTMPDMSKLTLFDVGQIEFANVSGWQPGSEKMHPIFGAFSALLDPYKLYASAGRDSFASVWLEP